jgi:hypothetical protein
MGRDVFQRALVAGLVVLTVVRPGRAEEAEMKPATLAAFDRYVARVEARLDEEERSGRGFLRLDAVPPASRAAREAALRGGAFHIERVETSSAGAGEDVPDGLVHHWVGMVFVPGATVDEAVALLQDYDRHDRIYAPAIARSKLIAREDDRFRLYLRFFKKKVIAVTIDSEHEAVYTHLSGGRVASRVRSTRTHEIEHAGTVEERRLPEGEGHGFLWRLNSYWRFAPADGGVWVQCESITLTRDIPFGLGWVVGPFVTSVPRESLEFTLDTTRRVLRR